MRDILDEVERWRESGDRVAIATVIQTWGSAPRPVGSAMALTAGGKIAGSVSGGCVEAAVVESGLRCLSTGRPERLCFAVTDETAWSVGLACGGTIDLFVEPLRGETFDAVRTAIREGRPAAMATVVAGAEGAARRSTSALSAAAARRKSAGSAFSRPAWTRRRSLASTPRSGCRSVGARRERSRCRSWRRSSGHGTKALSVDVTSGCDQ